MGLPCPTPQKGSMGVPSRATCSQGTSLMPADRGGASWAQPGRGAPRLGQWPAGAGGVVGGSPASLPLPQSPPHLTCNNLPDLVGGCHACGGVRAATAAPWPVSAAQPTGHAWPAAGGPLTWGVGWPQAGLGGKGCLPNTKQSPEQRVQGNGQDKAKACKETRRPLGEGCPSTAPPPPAERASA